jgi:hypothetical protein
MRPMGLNMQARRLCIHQRSHSPHSRLISADVCVRLDTRLIHDIQQYPFWPHSRQRLHSPSYSASLGFPTAHPLWTCSHPLWVSHRLGPVDLVLRSSRQLRSVRYDPPTLPRVSRGPQRRLGDHDEQRSIRTRSTWPHARKLLTGYRSIPDRGWDRRVLSPRTLSSSKTWIRKRGISRTLFPKSRG